MNYLRPMKKGNTQKSTGVINRTDTAGVISCYPLIDLNRSRVNGQPKGAERVSGLPLFKTY